MSARAPLLSASDAAATQLPISSMAGMEKAIRRNDMYPPECELPPSGWVINVAYHMESLPSVQEVRDTVWNAFGKWTRFGSIAREDGTWHPVQNMQQALDYHVVEEPASSDMRKTLEEMLLTDLDLERPLWRAHVIPSKCAHPPLVLLRVHHCIGDGVNFIRAIEKWTSGDDGGKPSVLQQMLDSVNAEQKKQTSGNFVQRFCKLFRRIPDICSALIVNLTTGCFPLETTMPFTKSVEERRNGLKFGKRRSIVSVPPHSLQYVKKLKNAAGVGLNTVQLSVFTGALRRYSERRGCKAFETESHITSRASLPVPLPPRGKYPEHDSLRNNFTAITFNLALGSSTPLERLEKTDDEFKRIRNSATVPVANCIEEKLLFNMPTGFRQQQVLEFLTNHSIDFSNVPGPSSPIFIGGKKVVGVSVALPNLLPQMILMSYDQKVFVTACVDPDAIQEADLLADVYLEKLRELGKALKVEGDPLQLS